MVRHGAVSLWPDGVGVCGRRCGRRWSDGAGWSPGGGTPLSLPATPFPRRIPSDTDADFESDPPREGPAGRADRLGGEEPGKARHGMGGRVVTAAGVTE
ncbi:Uncharacterised protein [Mycobacteroides abscessus subsp. abscessus]|nr:Uncharacterised protein [Mycobacteroides abscessus subsp. abscessus]